MMGEGQMTALKVAKKELRILMRTKLAEVSAGSVAEQCTPLVCVHASLIQLTGCNSRCGGQVPTVDGPLCSS